MYCILPFKASYSLLGKCRQIKQSKRVKMFVDFSNFLNQQGILIVLATIMQEAIHHCQNNAFFQLVLDSQKNFHIHISIL